MNALRLTLVASLLSVATAQDALRTGLTTVVDSARGVVALRVEWIVWNSPFRARDVQVGDRVLAIEGEPFRDEQHARSRQLGSPRERQLWQALGKRDGDEVQLRIQRDGSEPFDVRGSLHEPGHGLGSGGPDRLRSDGFRGAWASWYEDFAKHASRVLDGGFDARINTRRQLLKLEEQRARVDYLLANYPGPFAETVRADFERVRQCLMGDQVALTAADLAYRELGEQRVELVAAAAEQAHAKFCAQLGEVESHCFPAPSPATGEHLGKVGKLVTLPPVRLRNMFNDLGRAFLSFGSDRDGYYFVDCNSENMLRFFGAGLRYETSVAPKPMEQFELVGRVVAAPRMLTVHGRAVTGMMVTPLGGFANQRTVFVDLRNLEPDPRCPDDPARRICAFAGEEQMASLGSVEVAADASPSEVIAAMIQAVKNGNGKAWRSLIVDWQVWQRGTQPPLIDRTIEWREATLFSAFQRSRQAITGPVFDARVVRESPVIEVYAGDERLAIPRIEDVVVTIEHVGRFDGEYRTYSRHELHRHWRLQRLGNGPWRILQPQSL